MSEFFKKILAPRNAKRNVPVFILFLISICILIHHQYTSSSSFLRLQIPTPHPHLPERHTPDPPSSKPINNVAYGDPDSLGIRAIRDARRHHGYHRPKRPVRLPEDGVDNNTSSQPQSATAVEGAV